MTNNTPAPADLVEAVAKAICDRIGAKNWKDWVIEAQAAITAMRSYMASDGVTQMDRDLLSHLKTMPEDCPCRMCRAAKEENLSMIAAHRRAAAGVGREPVPSAFNDEALDWITANCMAIRRDSGDMDYSLGAMIKAYEAGKAAAITPQPDPRDAEIERLRGEVEKLRKSMIPQWFYADGYSSEECHDSPDEVIEYLDLKPGKHVVKVDCASPLPSIWCAVHIRTEQEMDALDTDDCVEFTEHYSEDEARAALAKSEDQ